MRKIEEITQGVKSAKENITKQEEALQDAITPLKEFGKNYPEFALKPKEALEKLLQEKDGQVAGAAFRDDLGGIDFVWGKDGKDGYGLAHILERREDQALSKGLNQIEAKEYALNVVKSIPEIIEKGVKVDNNGRMAIEYKHMRVGLNDKWNNQKLENKWVISSYEIYNSESGLPFRPIAQLQEVGLEPSKLTEPNPTTNTLKNQAPLSEQANAEKLRKLQDAITPLKEFGKNYPEFALKPKEALEKLLQEKDGQVAGAAFRDDLGGIDFVWGKDGKDGYGLAHILERREDQALSKGLNQIEAKEYALNVVKSIPEIIEKGVKVDNNGRIAIEYENIRVGLKDNWKGEKLPNHWVVTGYEKRLENSESLYASPLITKSENLPLNSNEPNPTTNTLKNQAPLSEQANAEKLRKLQDAITPLKEFGKNYPEFALKPKEALEKLLQEKDGQVAGAAFRDDLGGIDFVWGKDGKDGYGLAHILEKREKQYTRLGLNAEQIKERTDELLKSIPEVIEKGTLFKDDLGRVSVELNDVKVGLTNQWFGNDLKNHLIVTSYERDGKVLRELETRSPLSNDYKGNSNYSALNLNENNSTKKPLTSQEPPLSVLEKSQLEKKKKLESERLAKAEKERAQKIKDKEEAELRDKIRAQKNATLGKSELDREIKKSENIPYKELENAPKTSVSLNDDEIHPLKFVIVNKSDLKPNFKNTGTQTRTAVDSKKVEEIAERFDPKLIIGRGGFDDLPIILRDGQVIAGNHRIQGMLNFTPKSRYIYEKAIKEYYHIDLKPDELLVRLPSKRLNNTEINNLAASSNQGRFNSESDHAIAVLSHYEAKLKELDQKLDADSIYSLKNIVAKNLNFDKATHPNVGDSNLALLMYNMPRTKTQGIELLNRWQKEFSNDIKSYEKVKKMFVDNAGSFHNLIHDMNFPKVSLNAYLSDIMDRSFANLKNYQTTSESLKDLSEKFYKTSSLEMFEKSDQNTSDISEILGSAFARFARFDDPSKALFEALKSDNIKKGLKDFKIADVTKDMFNPDSKEFKDIDIYDFTHYLLMANREPNENNPTLKRLIEAVKDMQKETKKGIKEASKRSAKESEIKERAFKVIEDKEAFLKDLNAIKPMQLPREIDTESFLNAFNGVENKENFIKHLQSKPDGKHRLAYLHLVEPTLKEPDITLIFKDKGKEVKKEHIKAFQGDPKTIYYFLVTQDNDNKLITGLKVKPIYIKAKIDKADIIHSFIPQARTLKE
ncbi:hypothetical protein Kyoto57A_08930 [Helicobacter pylori]